MIKIVFYQNVYFADVRGVIPFGFWICKNYPEINRALKEADIKLLCEKVPGNQQIYAEVIPKLCRTDAWLDK